MSLDVSKLENVKRRGDKIIAACPACRAGGGDKKGNHLIVYPDGKFGCVVHGQDKAHNKEIHSLVGIPVERRKLTKQERRRYVQQKRAEERAAQRRHKVSRYIDDNLTDMLAPYMDDSWRAELFDTSPLRLEYSEAFPHDFLKSLFHPDDVLWMGEQKDSGQPKHAAQFKTCREWLKQETLPPRIAAGVFKKSSYSRSGKNVIRAPFIVLESDDLIGHEPKTEKERAMNRAKSYALIGYAQAEWGLTLRAVIDTGGKSLHAWLDKPPPDELQALEHLGKILGSMSTRSSIATSPRSGCHTVSMKKPTTPPNSSTSTPF